MENENKYFIPEQPVFEQEAPAAQTELSFEQPVNGYQQPAAVQTKPPVMLLPVFYIVATVASGIITALSSVISSLLLSYTVMTWGNVVSQIFGLISAIVFLAIAFAGIKVYNSKCKGLNIPEKAVPVYYVALFYLPDVFAGLITNVLFAIIYAVMSIFSFSPGGELYYILLTIPGTISGIAGIVFAFLIFNWVFKVKFSD